MGPPTKKTKVDVPSPRRGPLERKVEARILEFQADYKVDSLADIDFNLLMKFIDRVEPAFRRQKAACKDLFLKEGDL